MSRTRRSVFQVFIGATGAELASVDAELNGVGRSIRIANGLWFVSTAWGLEAVEKAAMRGAPPRADVLVLEVAGDISGRMPQGFWAWLDRSS